MEKQNLMDKKSYDVDFGSIEGKKYKTKIKLKIKGKYDGNFMVIKKGVAPFINSHHRQSLNIHSWLKLYDQVTVYP